MKLSFVLNTSIDPHFAGLFLDGKLEDALSWEDHKKDAASIFLFLKKHLPKFRAKGVSVSLGGVAGPGGFTSLRAVSNILNVLALEFNVPVQRIKAEEWGSAVLDTDFLLNSFGSKVWHFSSEKNEKILIDLLSQNISLEKLYIGFLPKEKQEKFFGKIEQGSVLSPKNLLLSLKKYSDKNSVGRAPQWRGDFIPEYDFPSV